jgi:hypothetical protein
MAEALIPEPLDHEAPRRGRNMDWVAQFEGQMLVCGFLAKILYAARDREWWNSLICNRVLARFIAIDRFYNPTYEMLTEGHPCPKNVCGYESSAIGILSWRASGHHRRLLYWPGNSSCSERPGLGRDGHSAFVASYEHRSRQSSSRDITSTMA